MAQKIYTASVSLSVPAAEPTHEFLNKRINTEMTYCGDIEALSYEDELTKLTMASGELTLLLDEDAK